MTPDRPFIWTWFARADWETFAQLVDDWMPDEDCAEFSFPRRIPRWLRRDRFVPTARVVRR